MATARVLQIRWHDKEPVFSIDVNTVNMKIATGGADNAVRIWKLHQSLSDPTSPVTYVGSMKRHISAVNVVRWSPDGGALASASDDKMIYISTPRKDLPTAWADEDDGATESWSPLRSLRYHTSDVFDIQWSPDGQYLVSGSTDNTVILWNSATGTVCKQLQGHSHFVQGVAWDPLGQYVATLANDQKCLIWTGFVPSSTSTFLSGQKRKRETTTAQAGVLVSTLKKWSKESCALLSPEITATLGSLAPSAMFHDESLPSFFRRLDFSPSGELLALPTGHCRSAETSQLVHGTFLLMRDCWNYPIAFLPSNAPAVVARFSPMDTHSSSSEAEENEKENGNENEKEKESGNEKKPWCECPLPCYLAVGTTNSVMVFDMRSGACVLLAENVHLAAITDICWLSRSHLICASRDGYISHIDLSPLQSAPVPIPEGQDIQPSWQAKEKENEKENENEKEKASLSPSSSDCVNEKERASKMLPEVLDTIPESIKAALKQDAGKRRITPIFVSE